MRGTSIIVDYFRVYLLLRIPFQDGCLFVVGLRRPFHLSLLKNLLFLIITYKMS